MGAFTIGFKHDEYSPMAVADHNASRQWSKREGK